MISILNICFTGFCIPEEVISDNGQQSTGKECLDFATKYGFKLTTSSAYYLKDHKPIERQVQTIKQLLSKCDGNSTDHYLALLQLTATPIDSRLPSPSELLQNRQLKTTLPAIIRPPAKNEAIWESLQSRQVYTKHDVHAKELPQVLSKQHVWVQNTMIQGCCKFKIKTPRSYVVSKPHGDKRMNRINFKESRYSRSCAHCTTQSTRKCAK